MAFEQRTANHNCGEVHPPRPVATCTSRFRWRRGKSGLGASTRTGDQTGGRASFLLQTDDFERDFGDYLARGVKFVRPPKDEPYGRVAVFKDIYGNLWDLIEPA